MSTLRYVLIGAVFAAATQLGAQDLLYTPQNPNFGGNTFNYQWLLQSATAQNGLTAPNTGAQSFNRTSSRRTSLEDFSESLNRQLLNSISRELFNFNLGGGEGGLQPGSYSLGNFQVDVVEGAEGLILTIVDTVNGGTTEVVVPFF